MDPELDLENMTILDEMELEDGSLEILLGEELEEEYPEDVLSHNANLAMFLDDELLNSISARLQARFEDDLTSNKEFFNHIREQLPRLGLKIERVNEPFPDASPITHPLIMENAIKSQAKIMGDTFNGKKLVDVYVHDRGNMDVKQRATAIRKFMDYQYLVQMPEYIAETEQLVLRFLLSGNAFRKYTYDPILDRPKTYFIAEDRFVCNGIGKTIYDLDFHTEILTIPRHTYQALVEAGVYKEVIEEDDNVNNAVDGAKPTETEQVITEVTGEALGFTSSFDAYSDLEGYEHHCYLELPEEIVGEERLLPYIVTREASTGKIMAIRRNWKEKDPAKQKRTWYSHYKMIPGLGFYGYGYIHLLGNFQFGLTQIERSLIDSGQFANLQGGFRAKGVRWTKESRMPIRFGEFREIETQQRPISEVIFPLNFKEPSNVLLQLFQFLDARAQKFADSTEQVIADSSNYGPVGTTVALLEASTKFMSGVQKRFYNSLKDEFKILYDLNYDTLDDQMEFVVKGEVFKVTRDMFNGSADVVPAADPNMASTAHKLSVANAKLQAALQAPQVHSLPVAYRDFYSALGMEEEEIDALVPPPATAEQADPMSDIIAVSQGRPIKAFPGQDHQAHIKFKTAFLNDPMGAKNPSLQQIAPALQANISEHQLMIYAERLQAVMGQVDANALGMERGQAMAAEALQKLNQMDSNMQALAAGDPTMLLAAAEMQNAQTRAKEAEVKEELSKEKMELERMKLAQKDGIERTSMQKEMVKQDKDLGLELVKLAQKATSEGKNKPQK